MTKPIDSAALLRSPAAAPDANLSEDKTNKPAAMAPQAGPMSSETAAQLRDMSERAGEPFLPDLDEMEARRRIAALREITKLRA